MEADWEFEIGGDAPVIEGYWSGFVDLRAYPERTVELSECRELWGLSEALIKLNAPQSSFWTSKTDVFTPERVDPDEMNASMDETVYTVACYIDLLPSGDQRWDSPFKAEQVCKRFCAGLRASVLRCCRVDVVVRNAVVADVNDLGATVYFTACGSTQADAKNRLGESLAAFTEVVVSLGA